MQDEAGRHFAFSFLFKNILGKVVVCFFNRRDLQSQPGSIQTPALTTETAGRCPGRGQAGINTPAPFQVSPNAALSLQAKGVGLFWPLTSEFAVGEKRGLPATREMRGRSSHEKSH